MPDFSDVVQRLQRLTEMPLNYRRGALYQGALRDAIDRIETLEAALRSPDRTARIIRNVAEWTDEARLGLFTALRERYCDGCGRAQPKEGRCQCQNEE